MYNTLKGLGLHNFIGLIPKYKVLWTQCMNLMVVLINIILLLSYSDFHEERFKAQLMVEDVTTNTQKQTATLLTVLGSITLVVNIFLLLNTGTAPIPLLVQAWIDTTWDYIDECKIYWDRL